MSNGNPPERALTTQNGNTQLAEQNDWPVELARMQQVDPDIASRAFAIILARPVDQYNPPLQPARALAAALFERQTGQVCGRDFYVDNRMGLVTGYRGRMKEAADRGIAEYLDDYRPFTAEENEEHGIKAGDSARVCELTIISRAKACRDAGIKYRPTVGYGIVKANEKVNSKTGQAIQLSGGYTWERKARNRALKDALSHAGFAATAAEILEDANVPPPEGAHLDQRQAQAWAQAEKQAAEVVGEYRSLTPEEQSARFAENVDTMRGPQTDDPLGVDAPAPQPETSASAQPQDEPPAGPEFDQLQGAPDERRAENTARLARLQTWLREEAAKKPGDPSEKQHKFALSSLATLCGRDNEDGQRAVIVWAFEQNSRANLSAGMCSALIEFIGSKAENNWAPSAKALEFWKLFNAAQE